MQLLNALRDKLRIYRALGQQNHIRALAVVSACKCGGSCQPAGIAPHDFNNRNAFQIVNQSVAHKLLCNSCNILCRTSVARGVIRDFKVIVNCFRNSDKAYIRLDKARIVIQFAHCVHGIVPADIEAAGYIMLLKKCKKLFIYFISLFGLRELIAARAEKG